jgi:hypothetical protein
VTLPFVIVGNPENRRVALFQEALAKRGRPAARVVRWLDLARGEDALAAVPREPALVRIDSFGEDFEVSKALLRRGFEDARDAGAWTLSAPEIDALPYDHGRIVAPRQEHMGFVRVLADLSRALEARPELRPLAPPARIPILFDKRACSRAFAAAGVPVPRPIEGVRSAADLRRKMQSAGVDSVFVKLTCGSSASCLALYQHRRGGSEWLFTSMEIDGERLYNSLRPRRYRDRAAIDRLLGFLFREGSHVEEHVPKARIASHFFDTRMLVVGGEVAFTVVRKSLHPITNLHLGGVRGTLEELARRIPADVLSAARESCRAVAEIYGGLHVGVDVMFTSACDGHRVLEANAFGDLLPNLTRDGLSVYEWEVRAALSSAPPGEG